MNKLYLKNLEEYSVYVDYERLANNTFCVTGANGLIASYFIDLLMLKADKYNISIIAIDKSKDIVNKYSMYFGNNNFNVVVGDCIEQLSLPRADYVLHMASNTNPYNYANNPISTVMTNTIGTYNMLKYAHKVGAKKFLFTTSVEVYGNNNGDVEKFDENYVGYINSNTVRASYPESKRCGETICAGFYKENNMPYNIVRIPRTFGSGILSGDTKATTLFVNCGAKGKDIILKSNGEQMFSFAYVGDVVLGIIKVILDGVVTDVYNISHDSYDMKLKDFANIIADISNIKVVFDLQQDLFKSGYSNVTKAMMDSTKLQSLGWNVVKDIKESLKDTIMILKN